MKRQVSWGLQAAGAAVAAAAAAMLLGASPALADPATTVSYPAAASATSYGGLAFDTCTAPSLADMQAWGASPYHAIGSTWAGRTGRAPSRN
jgi:hypothetical protein